MATKKRSDKNSTTSIVAGFAGAVADIPLPAGVELRSDEEQVLWDQYARAQKKIGTILTGFCFQKLSAWKRIFGRTSKP